ncbi:RNA helicase Mov10l1-like [Parasteatoda tepidariorum]|uniref:RNA helicase Mov10l1-like n=1 Tax=Parasteatoda tepidariorum TaxID=114398 RepID=UPI001C719E55|nr:RNA helicase Mov10l1 [Parasteatoda tepidariorum]XP_015917572.2 RNA helicase Mov10l1 [Parasteatoda tepidariorum]XP_042908108.1 RNA helicase Mov10l1 [Parasteatoda tepidariorum]
MFTLLAKFVSLAWDWTPGNKVKSNSNAAKESAEDSSKYPKQRRFTGVVTNLNRLEEYGLVDRSVFFTFEAVYARKQLSVGDYVLVNAVKKEPHQAWIASYVEFTHKPPNSTVTNTNSNAKNNKSKDYHANSSSSKETMKRSFDNRSVKAADFEFNDNAHVRVEVIEQTVSECSGKYGKLKDGFEFCLEDGEIGFEPIVGDVLSATVEYKDCSKTVTSWKPKELKCIEGKVTAWENDCGIINDEAVFFRSSCRRKVTLFVGQKVSAMVASSEQGIFQWRAFSLTTSDTDDVSNIHKPYFSYMDDVHITDPLSFDNIYLGHENRLVVQIENKSSAELKLRNCQFQNKKGVFYLSKHIYSEQTIPVDGVFDVLIHCKTEAIGQHEDFLLFEFSDFFIKRTVTVTVVDPIQHILKPTAPFSMKSKSEHKKLDCEGLVIIPGKKPFKPVLHFTNKLPPSNIPRALTRAVQNREDLRYVVPWLFKTLTMNNYITKFSTLLHLEELQVRYDMKKFDLSEVCLQRRGEYLCLEVNGLAEGRPSLIVGDKAILVPPHQNSKFAFEGCIHEVHLNEVLLKFNDSFHNSYTGESFDVRFELNRTNFRRLHQCVHHVAENHEYAIFPTKLRLKDSLIDADSKSTKPNDNYRKRQKIHSELPTCKTIKYKNEKLNWKQKEAVVRILECRSRPLPYVIFGPPGTGKTVTLVEAVLQVFENIPNSRIIICTPSNSAADLVAHRIIESNLIEVSEMVRLNSYQRSVDSIPDFIKPFCQDKDSLDHLTQYRIIISTCSTAGALYTIGLCNDFFTHVFIDEAGQLMEPESDIALGFIDLQTEGQVIMAGDPQQLGPVLRSSHSQSCGLQVSFLERLMNTPLYSRNEKEYKQHGGYNPLLITMLEESYRSHPHIIRFPSDMFYFSQIVCRFPMDKNYELLTHWGALPAKGFPVIFHGVKGEEHREENSPSWFNPTEVVQVTQYLQKLYDFGLKPDDVGIIAPYKKQVEKIRLLMTALSLEFCKIGSVEEFQGQERRAIIISTVRSSDQYVDCDILYNLGFISNPKRLNVAITRSQELLIVVGNPHILSKDFFWNSFVRYCVVNDCYTGCELPMSFIQNVNNS